MEVGMKPSINFESFPFQRHHPETSCAGPLIIFHACLDALPTLHTYTNTLYEAGYELILLLGRRASLTWTWAPKFTHVTRDRWPICTDRGG